MATALATEMKRRAYDVWSVSSRSAAPIFSSARSMHWFTRLKVGYSGCLNHIEFSGKDRIWHWRPLGLLRPYRVQKGTVAVTERFGKFRKILHPGKHWLVPIIDSVASIHATEELNYSINHFWCMTKDEANISINGLLFCKVVEPMLAYSIVVAPISATVKHARHVLLTAMAKITLREFLTGRDSFIANVLASINGASIAWGIECTQFEIVDLSFPVGGNPYPDTEFFREMDRDNQANSKVDRR